MPDRQPRHFANHRLLKLRNTSTPKPPYRCRRHVLNHNEQEAAILAYLSFRDVSYHAGNRVILDRLSLDVEHGETLVLLGRSGSGKTTALRLINRMLTPSSGSIFIDGKDIATFDAIELRRKIGYVIQEFGLLPHWTVEQNISLVPRLLGWPADKQRERSSELLQQVGLASNNMASRKPRELSGGQRQRVAVARALAAQPLLLLFDEPFGALDPVTRHEMQQQFLRLRAEYDVASVFVTHDLLEAVTLGTRIAVLDEGKLEALVTPREALPSPNAYRPCFSRHSSEGIRAGNRLMFWLIGSLSALLLAQPPDLPNPQEMKTRALENWKKSELALENYSCTVREQNDELNKDGRLKHRRSTASNSSTSTASKSTIR